MAAPLGNEFYKMRINTGAPRKFDTPEDLAAAFNSYFEYIEASPLKESVLMKVKVGLNEKVKVYNRPLPRAMTIQGFCAFTGFASTALYEYEKQEGYREIIARAKEVMFSQKIEGAAAGLFNPSIIARELGLTEKTEQRIIQEQPLFDDSDED
jgi:hypothetical protein